MPAPSWLAKLNRAVFNPREIKKGKRPVLLHRGRSTGLERQTPLDAHKVDDGYLFIAVYGPDSDWVRNILVSGTATLRLPGEMIELESPRLLDTEGALQLLPPGFKVPGGVLNVQDFLHMKTA